MSSHSLTSLRRRLSAAGFKPDFIRRAVLPEWWNDDCESDPHLLEEFELRVARLLGTPLHTLRDPQVPLAVPRYPRAQLRRVRNVDGDRLAPAIHVALRVAGAVVRNVALAPLNAPPSDAARWRGEMNHSGSVVTLTAILSDLWARGIPVVYADALPAPSFQGLACVVASRPVVVLSHAFDEPSRLAFIIAHEVGHIVNGDCAPDQPVVDDSEEVTDHDEIEQRADQYATRTLCGDATLPSMHATNFRDLAKQANDLEKQGFADAGAILWSWARRSGDYAMATMAAQALYLSQGGRRAIREAVRSRLDLANASESDAALLRCVIGDEGVDATTGRQ
jgi:hypothetical protein